jgi:uncharacterized damage-inducible protein DinB
MTAKEAQIHFQYSTWASARLLEAALKLSPEDANKDLGCSHKGVLETLNHIHMADRSWLFRVLGETMEQPTEALEVEWPKIQKKWEEWVDALKDEDMTRAIAYKDLKGNFHVSPIWQIVLHVVNHATLHRGQVMAMFRQLGQAPPPTDLIFYYREQKIA